MKFDGNWRGEAESGRRRERKTGGNFRSGSESGNEAWTGERRNIVNEAERIKQGERK